jgi:NADH:ubiquinone oxidoreductase subunit 4 (subunit M)
MASHSYGPHPWAYPLDARGGITPSIYLEILSVVMEDVLAFYLLFEVMLLVMYIAVASYWYSARSSYALYMLVVYTLLGSACMGIALLLQYVVHGSTSSPQGLEICPSGH